MVLKLKSDDRKMGKVDIHIAYNIDINNPPDLKAGNQILRVLLSSQEKPEENGIYKYYDGQLSRF